MLLARETSLVAAICAVLLATLSHADALTGNEWRTFKQGERQAFVAGVIDAWFDITEMTLSTSEHPVLVPNSGPTDMSLMLLSMSYAR